MKKSFKISIIVTVYNTKLEWLERCFNTLVGQTYEKIEIIIVDDGSGVEVGNYCDTWGKFPQIQIIHKENGGLSSARNAGMDIADGDYIMFVDSDDWLEENACEKCVEVLDESVDLLLFAYTDEFVNRSISLSQNTEEVLRLNKSQMRAYRVGLLNESDMPVKGCIGTAWGRLYSRVYLEKHRIKFIDKISNVEDKLFNLSVAVYEPRTKYLDIVLYHYRQCNGSLCRTCYDFDTYQFYMKKTQEVLVNFDDKDVISDAFERYAINLYIVNYRNRIVSDSKSNLGQLEREIDESIKWLEANHILRANKKLKKSSQMLFFLMKNKMFLLINAIYKYKLVKREDRLYD